MDAEAWSAVGSAGTAVAAIFAAISAFASLRTTRRLEAELENDRRLGAYQLLDHFEKSYRDQYDSIMRELGPWPDPVESPVEPNLRRVVHDLLVSLSSVYRSAQSGLIPEAEADYVSNLYAEWLRNPNAKDVWVSVFRPQSTWPEGFVDYVDEVLARPSAWEAVDRR